LAYCRLMGLTTFPPFLMLRKNIWKSWKCLLVTSSNSLSGFERLREGGDEREPAQ
jgi:hypothetical protein